MANDYLESRKAELEAENAELWKFISDLLASDSKMEKVKIIINNRIKENGKDSNRPLA